MTQYLALIAVLFFALGTEGRFGPFSTTDPTRAHRRAVDHPLGPSRYWGSMQRPYPTNSWWGNLVVGTGEQTLNTFPYLIKAKDRAVCFNRPHFTANRDYVISHSLDEWCIETPNAERRITSYDDLSVTVKYPAGSAEMTFPFVPGTPYVVAETKNMKVKVRTIMAILRVWDERGKEYKPGNGVVTEASEKYTMELNNGHKWAVYFDRRVSLRLYLGYTESADNFSGVVKFAMYENNGMLRELDRHRRAYAAGADVDYRINGDRGNIQYSWKKRGSGELLMLSLPHHQKHIKNTRRVPAMNYRTIRGNVMGMVGDSWSLELELPTYTWDSPTGVDGRRLDRIKEALRADADSQVTQGDPYFFGVAIGRLARLALIADQLNEAAIAAKIRSNMEDAIVPWLMGTNPDALLYDKTYGGIVSTKGVRNQGADFGNGYYNDHHFHYGYHVYACAVIGKGNPGFLGRYREEILTYARDYANPSRQDRYFPTLRNKDWFGWHSWAAGLFEFGDGKNQESTSEALMSYYGLMLLGEAMHNREMKDLGRLLLGTEMVATKTYWHIPSWSRIYPDAFKPNKMVGVLWGNKVDYSTFFGKNVIFIHGIQMLPFLPPTEQSLDKEFIKEEYELIKGETSPADWMPYKACARAVIDPDGAWNDALGLRQFHTGTCRTIVLHWIATRPR